MKVVTKQELYSYPSGTVYSDYEDGVIDGLYIKTQSIEDDDWNIVDLLDPEFNGEPYKIIDDLENGKEVSYHVSNEINSDLNNFEGSFIVYSKKDVWKIIEVLENAVKQS
ncbi:MAG: hypothetical protein ACOCQD_05190 [archaeon]